MNPLDISPIYTTKTKHTVETYKGISRQEYPKWAGWKLIKEYKKEGVSPSEISDEKLDILVINFYYLIELRD